MKVLAWISFGLAVIAGAGLAASATGLVQFIVIIAALAALSIDIAKDRTPNLVAVAVAVTLPSMIGGMNGRLADHIRNGLASLWNWAAAGWLGNWAGTTSTLALALGCVAVSFIVGRRTMPRSASGGGRF